MTTPFYLGNHLLKRAGVKTSFTKKQVDEYLKCANDPEYFIERYVKIVNVDRGLIKFKLYTYQKKLIWSFINNRFTIAKLPRQSGKSVTVTSYMLWLVLFNDQQNIAILANKGALARQLLAKIQLAYENLPKWIQQGVVTWNKGDIELENGSKILAASTTSSAIRGGSFNLILLDEFSFISRNIAETFFASVYPTISSGATTKIIIVSTPNGLNHFYKMWEDAKQGRSLYYPIEINWWETPGRDEKWKAETIRNTSEEQFKSEFETEFIGSSNTLVAGAKLRAMPFKNPIKISALGVKLYDLPANGHIYTACVDTAHGVGLDASAFSIFDVTTMPFVQVAAYRNTNINPASYPDVISKTSRYYNNAIVLGESNDIGYQVLLSCQDDLELDTILTTVQTAARGQQLSGGFARTSRLGVRMTSAVKRIGCSNLKELVEKDQLIVQDFDTISELGSFVSKGRFYEAEEGQRDDLAMGLVLFGWLARQPYFRDFTNTNYRARLAAERLAAIEEDLIPLGYDDGRSDFNDPIGPLGDEISNPDDIARMVMRL